MKEYKTIEKEVTVEFTEKRSRFLGHIKPVKTEQEAIDFINEKREKYWDASHNVYAYSLKEGNIKRYTDDGEPSGTAGVPIFDIIIKEELFDLVVVVTRYFGGILLGTGGLVHAYSKGAADAIKESGIIIMEPCDKVFLNCNYSLYGKIQNIVNNLEGKIENTVFTDSVDIYIVIPCSTTEKLRKEITAASSGSINIDITETLFCKKVIK